VYLARGPGEAFAAGRPAPIGLTAPEVAGWVKLAGAADNPAVVLSARYRNGRQLADVAVFVPTAGHDDPILEFVRQGWVVRQREPLDAADDGTAMRLRLERPLDASGTLWLVNGSAQSRPAAVDAGTLARRLDRHLGRPAPAGSADRWLWVFVESYRPLDATWLRPPEQLFVEVRKQLGPRLAAGGEAP
jgi:hypothetical protein